MMGFLTFVAFVVFIVFIIKGIRSKKKNKPGKKNYLIAIIAFILFVIFAIASSSSGKSNKSESTEENTLTEQSISESQTATTSSTQSEQESSTSAESSTEESNATSSSTAENSNLTIEITAGELGEYGKDLVLNEGTEFEDKTIGYFVPTGTYKITNIGDYRTQVNVYKNEKNKTDEGWEEWADGKSEALDVNASVEMTVDDGYFVNVDEPSHILLEKID
ncbi:MAG: hypothetical protein LKG40_05370 [Lachnospiraceae bacterium]|jgi:guanyl-specific ribonuclease Sa|nr:hypothetical protein [Lachnospiraceae bacterium]MCI1328291.1 hypothetical protein [Lachnospiraceae bacterium]